MKLKILILTFIGFNQTLNAQSFVPFPFHNAEWIYQRFDFDCSGHICYDYYKTQGDTILQGKNYNKLYSGITFLCGIRQDSVDGKLYMLFPDACDNTDTLIYNFNWALEDTIKICPRVSGEPYVLIENIDSVQVLGQWRKRINLLNSTEAALIDGIGSTSGIIGPWNGWIGGYENLVCFLINGQGIYPNNCSINNIIFSQNPSMFDIYPNVIKNNFQIRFSYNENRAIQINIINIFGEIVKSINLSLSRSLDKAEIDVSDIQSGFYLVSISSNKNHLYYSKIIISK